MQQVWRTYQLPNSNTLLKATNCKAPHLGQETTLFLKWSKHLPHNTHHSSTKPIHAVFQCWGFIHVLQNARDKPNRFTFIKSLDEINLRPAHLLSNIRMFKTIYIYYSNLVHKCIILALTVQTRTLLQPDIYLTTFL